MGNSVDTEHSTDSPLARPIVCRGIRGAITADENTSECILATTRQLLLAVIEANELRQEDIASVYFTTTPDLNAEYPALAARQLGWHDVALMCGHEMAVPQGMKSCIRVMIHWNTNRRNDEIHHVYLRDAVKLRPDRSIELPPQALAQEKFNQPQEEISK